MRSTRAAAAARFFPSFDPSAIFLCQSIEIVRCADEAQYVFIRSGGNDVRRMFSKWLAPFRRAVDDSLPIVASGRIERLSNFPSKFVDARNIDVWLPESYSPSRRCRVIYMHDGQTLFSGQKIGSRQFWGVAETASTLIGEGKLEELIVVGIWNNGRYRDSEYFPQKALAFLPGETRIAFVDKKLGRQPRADRYLHFIVEEVKPAIDGKFATRPGRDETVIMGSSMGALISLYAICEYPQVFGAAACLSTHWLSGLVNDASIPLATFEYLRNHIPDPACHRIYMDRGTVGLDASYAVHQQFFDLMMADKGYGDGNYVSHVFPGAGHDEGAWAARLKIPLMFIAPRVTAFAR